MVFQMNKQRQLHMGGDPAAAAAGPEAAPPPDAGDSGDDATKAKALLQQLSDVIEHWAGTETGEAGAEMPPAAGTGAEDGY